MREIVILIKNNQITASTDFAGYAGEHNATILKFELAPELENPKYTYQANITLADGITTTVALEDMSLTLTKTLTACDGLIPLQLVITESGSLIYKSGVIKLKIKPSLKPTAVIGNATGIEGMSVDDDGNLIVVLTDGKTINAGYVKGEKGEDGATYTLSDADKEEVANKLTSEIIRGFVENNVTAFEVPEGTTKISDNKFENDVDLRRLIIPDSVETIGINAFYNCFRMTGIEGFAGVKEIKDNAFFGCGSLTDIKLPETLEIIGTGAFQQCGSFRGDDIILPNCKKVGQTAFAGCTFTGKLELPNCEEIRSNAFSTCNFTSLVLSNKLKLYDNWQHALGACTNLEFVELGEDFDCNGLVLSMSTKYSVETLVNVLNSLKDRTGEVAYSLGFGAGNLSKLTDEQKAIATDKNWVLY